MNADSRNPLDLYSTSQTNQRCAYGAPYCAVIVKGQAVIQQTCCNHWDCPLCGQTRAKQEYRRIVWGAEVLADDHKLYFWTLTCRGRECSLEEAEEMYYAWTNILLTNARTKAKREMVFWAYVQITERQKKTRKHPHSHIITTFLPGDACEISAKDKASGYTSEWFSRANVSAGLGAQHRISEVKSASAVSRYVAKYMFKDMMREEWPRKWKRVRYSQNWPKPPAPDFELAIPLIDKDAWQEAANLPVIWLIDDIIGYEMARHRIANIALRQADIIF